MLENIFIYWDEPKIILGYSKKFNAFLTLNPIAKYPSRELSDITVALAKDLKLDARKIPYDLTWTEEAISDPQRILAMRGFIITSDCVLEDLMKIYLRVKCLATIPNASL